MLQIHVFTDSSEAAFACAAYLRAEIAGTVHCALVAAKSKVAPLKLLSIPRLELQAAVIGARLLNMITTSHNLPITSKYIWTDSRTVLAWINSDQRKYRQFVAFRIGEILSKTNVGDWRWVPSKMNVADEATKWGSGPQLSSGGRWYRGPSFLYEPESCWPTQPTNSMETTEELRTCAVHHHELPTHVVWDRFSRWDRLLRSIGYVRRFILNIVERHRATDFTTGPLSQCELAAAEEVILRLIQRESYPEEMEILTSARNSQLDERQTKRLLKMEKQSKLFRLSPFVDEKGVLRQESRAAQTSFVPYDTRCPIILPRSHRVTKLIIAWYHMRYLHEHHSTVLNEMQQRFYVSNLRSLIRKSKQDCMFCRVYTAKPTIPRMGPLPAARMGAFFRPFTFVGLDYFGPMTVRVGRSLVKRWVALFTCLSIRAVHLEVVHSLTTVSCKKAIRRFVIRRGAPLEIYSDNATNFVGASNDLIQESRSINGQLSQTFTNTQTKWLFIPPSAPHMGGAWERLVRSVKTAVYAMSASDKPDEETFSTVMAEAEGVVNSRPLTFIALESTSQEALTPNHFLLLNSNGVVQPPRDLLEPKAVGNND
ncbi:uncharacterized protein LOC129773964 [Toxorhynchites rutilus septentrionalis]|uniref:uncharacterized protein LOC129773964 n=1 Tax=Toxorhynchites rutilus septentrionalis TaxID=329112 RepID=UPI00247A92AD|nr:uncharacterized protein LOC129773964 [Toxorhynchites rutilus septentrionalis]